MSWKKRIQFFDKVDVSVTLAKFIFNFLAETFHCKTIADIATTTSGGTPLRGHADYYGGEIPWIKSGELNDGLITSFEESITETGLKNSSAKIYPKGTLVLALYGATAGKTGILDFDSASNQAVAAIYPNAEVERDYLFWFFRQKRFEYLQMSFGAAQPNISQAVVKATTIAVPERKIQKQIVDFLNRCEKDQELLWNESLEPIKQKLKSVFSLYNTRQVLLKEIQQQQTYLRGLRQAILQEAVQGKLTVQHASDEPATELLARIKAEKAALVKRGKIKKEKELPPITDAEIPFALPNGWVWCRLGKLTNLISGVTLGKTYIGELFEVPYLRVANVQRGFIDTTNLKRLSLPKSEIKKFQLVKGDLCMIEGGDWDKVGRCSIWKGEINPCIHQNHIFRLRFYGSISNDWAELFLNSPDARRYFENSSKQTTNLASINQTQLKNIVVPLPPLAEQKRIVEKVERLMQHVSQLEQQVAASQTQAQGLLQAVLQEAFTTKPTYAMNDTLSLAAEP